MNSKQPYDIIVIGGGFYGVEIALDCRRRGAKVALVEREPRLLQKASLGNQARVHGGYHYPRSLMTGLRSRANYASFVSEFSDCVQTTIDHYYAIAGSQSKVSPHQFENFCRRINAPLKKAPTQIRRLFDAHLISEVYKVEECVFNAEALRLRLTAELEKVGVDVYLNSEVENISNVAGGEQVALSVKHNHSEGSSAASEFLCYRAYLCTYAATNEIITKSNLNPIPLEMRLSELAMIELPESLKDFGVTVMCGPFFSVLPFPARNCHSLSHVKYTHAKTWQEPTEKPPLDETRRSLFPHMIRDATRYLPLLKEAKHLGSLWETKTLMPRNSANDGRPILFMSPIQMPRLKCVIGSKIDNIYDVQEEIQREGFV